MTATNVKQPAATATASPWDGFSGALWQRELNVRAFIQLNYTPYDGDASFLAPATARTKAIWDKLKALFVEERKKGVLDISQVPSSIIAHDAGYIDKDHEIIVGLQTEAPLKRAIMPNGGFRMVLSALKTYGYEPDPHLVEAFTKYRKTHNEGVFDAYTADIRRCRSSHVLTGLPDAYGRGRIIGDYRRVALYGVDRLIEHKKLEKKALDPEQSTESIIRDREELSEQIRALDELKKMAAKYGYDISGPARTAREAVQWLYFAYLAAVKEQNGAAMSLGRCSTFLDIYFERDLKEGRLTEESAQEIIDDFVIKLRIVRFLRTPEYDELFAGDPTWVTESIGGMGDDGRSLVTKMQLPDAADALQPGAGARAEPDHLVLRANAGRIPAVCVQGGDRHQRAPVRERRDHAAHVGRRWRHRVLRLADAGWQADAVLRRAGQPGQVPALCHQRRPRRGQRRPGRAGVEAGAGRVPRARGRGHQVRGDDGLAGGRLRQCHERHPLHARQVRLRADRNGAARLRAAPHHGVRDGRLVGGGRQPVGDQVREGAVVRDETGLITDYQTEGEFPMFGNNDNRVDQIATWVVSTFMSKLRKYPTYRNAVHTQSILTITSNVVYGKATGNTPDGRRHGEPFAPGANPMHGRDSHGIHASAASVAKIPYRDAADGISLTTTLVPEGLGRVAEDRVTNLTVHPRRVLRATGYHMNINVLNREMLLDAMEHPEKYPSLTIRVSGYAVNFVRLTREQQMDVINRTFHGA